MSLDHDMPVRFPGAVVRDWGCLEVCEIPGFATGEYDAVCRIEACSICAATDTHLVDGTFPRQWCAKPPFVLGHESAGHVMSIGPKVRHYRVGQRVVRPMWVPDEPMYQGLGSSWGGFASWGIIRDVCAMAEDTGRAVGGPWGASAPLPEMSARDATLFVTWRDCAGCLLDLGVHSGQRVAVFGSGANGLSFVRMAKLLGASVVLVGSAARFARAAKLGACACIDYRHADAVPAQVREALGAPADLIIEAVGSPAHLPHVLGALADGGKLFLFGLPEGLRLMGNWFDGPETFAVVKKFHDTEPGGHEQTLAWYQQGLLRPEDFCDGELPLEQIQAGFDAIRRREAIKLALRMPE